MVVNKKFVYLKCNNNNKNQNIMKSAYYEGQSLESLQNSLKYVNDCLSNVNLQAWERKEYQELKEEYEFKINSINDYNLSLN